MWSIWHNLVVSKSPRSILEYPVVVRKVLKDMVISIPDLGFWISIPLPPVTSGDGRTQSLLNDDYLLEMAKGIKSAWIKGHRHIMEKKWVPEASTFKQSVQKAEKDLTVPAFKKLLKPYMDISLNTIRREIKRGAIRCRRTSSGGHYRIPRSQLELYVMKISENQGLNPAYPEVTIK